ncbi:MAG: recombination protein O N-terminal domain-containing protein [Opitutales bacterium]|nr:recombination protein O N-terminal domain-containing protein [Opitutales bacterium]
MKSETPAVVLSKDLHGESFIRFNLYTREHGLITALMRKSVRRKTGMPDLFQTGSATIERKNTEQIAFLTGFEAIIARVRMASTIPGFETACRFSRILVMNTRHMEVTLDLFDLINRCLDGWEKGGDPNTILLKSLYLLASSEGFPVRQEWYNSLSPNIQQRAADAIFSPLAEQQPRQDTADLLQALEHWLVHSAGFTLP